VAAIVQGNVTSPIVRLHPLNFYRRCAELSPVTSPNAIAAVGLHKRYGDTHALQGVERSSVARDELSKLQRRGPARFKAQPAASKLQDYGTAPDFTGVSQWINSKPLTLQALRGKVVLVDFWTYSCINCLRTLPHLEAWDKRYRKAGLVIVGVHTPEFAFEHVVSNVREAARKLGVRYPVAIDDDYRTWDAYQNDSWPAEYLIDKRGHVREIK